ncbi:MAG: RluA family pseudouridine synthase [Pseudomonadota bacterium]|jgi:23S rRNA-/tRNA-specific pseudouridylate synthase
MSNDNFEGRLAKISASFFSSYWRWELSDSEPTEVTVEAELAKRLPHIPVSTWPARFDLGGVYVAGELAHLGMPLAAPCRLEYYEPRMSIERVATFYPRFSTELLLYVDQDCLVVHKPAGLPTTPARDQQRYSMQRYLEQHLGCSVHMPSRLDIGVSGVVLCSLSSRMNRYLQKAYDRRWIEKFYIAEVVGSPSWSTRVCEQSLERDPRHPVLRRCVAVGGESARTRLLRLGPPKSEQNATTFLQAEPITGRTHQIRVHCAYEGFPIIGDPFYGIIDDPELHLMSYAVKFFHPFKQQHLSFCVPRELWPAWLQGVELPSF